MDPDQNLPQDQGHPGKNGEISFETKTLGDGLEISVGTDCKSTALRC